MEHFASECHFGRLVGEVLGEGQGGGVNSPLVGSTGGALEAQPPSIQIAIDKPDGES